MVLSKIIQYLLVVLFFSFTTIGYAKSDAPGFFGTLFGITSVKSLNNKKPNSASIRYDLLQAAIEINKNLPMQIDNNTTLESVGADISGNNLIAIYYYKINSRRADEIDKQKFIDVMRPHLISNSCSEIKMIDFFKNGITVRYSYRDKFGKNILSLDVNPSNCGY